MAILLHEDFTFIVQGITGREAVNLTRESLDFGSNIVGGVTPGRKGRDVHGVPVYDTVGQVPTTSTPTPRKCAIASRTACGDGITSRWKVSTCAPARTKSSA